MTPINALNKAQTWIVAHPWQIATGVLAVALAGVLVFFRPAAPETSDATTSSTSATTSTIAPPTTTEPGQTTAPTTIPQGDRVDPFTGEVRGGGPLVIVKVDNAPEARPQVGLAPADLIVEVPAEGGITRLSAMFLDQIPNYVGPVRSLRPVDADLLAPFPGVVIASGGQRHVLGAVAGAGLTIADPNQPGLLQNLERPAPHNLFAGLEVVDGEVALPTVPPWEYGQWGGGEALGAITIPYGGETVEWRYDGLTWTRHGDGDPTQVMETPDGASASLTRDTVIVLFAHQKEAGYTDSAGTPVPDFDLVGGGEVWVIHQGELIRGTWLRLSQSDPWRLTTESGEALAIPMGSLYLSVVPSGTDVIVVP